MRRIAGSPYAPGLLVALLALLVRLHHLGWGLPDVYEEATSVQKAWGFWGWGGRGLDLNPHFFNYPSLHFYLQFGLQALLRAGGKVTGAFPDAAAFQAAYVLRPGLFIWAGRLLTALMASASVFVLFATGLRLGGKRVALVAALILALHTVHVQKSRFVEVDVTMTFFALLSTYFLARHVKREGTKAIYLAGGAVGLAAATKYPGALFLLGLPVAELLRGEGFRWRRLVLAMLVAGCVFLAATPYVVLDSGAFLRDFGAEGVHMREGHFGGEGDGVAGALRLFAQGFGWPLFLLAVAGLVLAAARPAGIERLLVPLPVLFFALLSASRMQAPHYPLPVVPSLALLAALLLERALAPRTKRRGVAYAIITGLLLAAPVVSTARGNARLGGRDARTLAREWIEEQIPSGALVLLEPHGPNLRSSNEISRYAEREEYGAIRQTVIPKLIAGPWYRTAVLPSFSIDPGRAGRFYRFELYQWFEYVVLSHAAFDRYLADPDRYPAECAFYDALMNRFRLVSRFAPGSSPGIEIYRREPGTTPLPVARLDPAGAGDGEFALFFRSIAGLYADRGLPGEAVRLYRALLELDPNDTETLLHLSLLIGARGDAPAAVGLLERGVRIDPEDRQLRMNLGVFLCRGGRLEEGIALFEALLREGEDAEVHGNLASALIQAGRVGEAAAHLRRFLEMAPTHARAPEIRSLLESLRGDGP